MKSVKKTVEEILEVVSICPENLKESCFEILLTHSLYGETDVKPGEQVPPEKPTGDNDKESNDQAPNQEDLTENELHIKVKRFLKSNGLTVANLNELFYKENGNIRTMYEDLGSTKASESQIRIVLLRCLHNALSSGEFQTDVEGARNEARDRKCYDSNNWAAYFNYHKELFGIEKYTKELNTIGLSPEGRARLAELIKELQV